jgi:hypothetical protein
MEDVLDVYKRPYDPRRPQLCMDDVSKQLVGEVRAPLPARPGQPAVYHYEYVRNGVTNIFMVFEPLAGRRHVKVTDRRTRRDWAELMREVVDVHYPEAQKIVLVMDNLNTRAKSSLHEAFAPGEAKRIAGKLEIHCAPKHGSWLNAAESELSHLSRQCLARRIADAATLKKETQRWNEERNMEGAPVDWRFTTADARIKLRGLYLSFQRG